jgi:hypothetical protein
MVWSIFCRIPKSLCFRPDYSSWMNCSASSFKSGGLIPFIRQEVNQLSTFPSKSTAIT